MDERVSTDDYVAIMQLMADYCHHIDEGEAEAWAACFTEDGRFSGAALPAPAVGQAALMEVVRTTWLISNGGRMRHQIANLAARYGGSRDEAVGRLYNLVTVWGAGGRPQLMALCSLAWRRTPDGWRIASNHFETLGIDPA